MAKAGIVQENRYESGPSRGVTQVACTSLFNLLVGMLAIFIARAKEDGQNQGLIPRLVDDGLSILLYANDTILFTEQ